MVKTRMQSAKGIKGFTLIELMMAIAIIGILAAIAYPNYQNYVVSSRRAAAQSDMLEIQLGLEKWRANNSSYASTLDHTDDATNLTPADLADNLSTANTYYDYVIQNDSSGGSPDASHYYIKATPQGAQTADTSCTSLTLDQSGAKGPSGCWKN